MVTRSIDTSGNHLLDSILSHHPSFAHIAQGGAGGCRVVTPAGIHQPLRAADSGQPLCTYLCGLALPLTRAASWFPSLARDHQRLSASAHIAHAHARAHTHMTSS